MQCFTRSIPQRLIGARQRFLRNAKLPHRRSVPFRQKKLATASALCQGSSTLINRVPTFGHTTRILMLIF